AKFPKPEHFITFCLTLIAILAQPVPMYTKTRLWGIFCSLLLLSFTVLTSRAQLIWTVGTDDNGWPMGDGGGANASFMQDNGVINDLPGDPLSPEADTQADNDYYFAGQYDTAIQSVIDAYI